MPSLSGCVVLLLAIALETSGLTLDDSVSVDYDYFDYHTDTVSVDSNKQNQDEINEAHETGCSAWSDGICDWDSCGLAHGPATCVWSGWEGKKCKCKKGYCGYNGVCDVQKPPGPQAVPNTTHISVFGALSSAAYHPKVDELRNFSCPACKKSGITVSNVKPFYGKQSIGTYTNDKATFAIVAKVGSPEPFAGGCFLAIRGTAMDQAKINALMDVEISMKGIDDCDGCQVSTGSFDAWHAIEKNVVEHMKANCKNVFITGHSLGAGMATIAAVRLRTLLKGHDIKFGGVVTFESPRIGNYQFAAHFEKIMREGGTQHWRITHADDPVVHLPPIIAGCIHVRGELFLDEKGEITTPEHLEDPNGASKFQLFNILGTDSLSKHCKGFGDLVPGGDIC